MDKLKKLVESTPNDTVLGGEVRKLFNTKETNMLKSTSYIAIETPDGSIQLADILNKDTKKPWGRPYLFFEGANEMQDNSEYVKRFLKGLYKHKNKSLKELKQFCEKYDFDYQSTLQNLVDIYLSAKHYKLFKHVK